MWQWANVSVLAAAIAMIGSRPAMGAERAAATYRLDMYALELNGDAQIVTGLNGGFIDGVVVTEKTGAMPKKRLGGVVIEPVRARVGVDQFTKFLAESLEGKAERTKGMVYYIDASGKVQQQRELNGVTLSELAFPGLSGASRPSGLQLTMTLAAESVKAAEALAGALPPVKVENGPAAKAKKWAGDFRLQVPGLPTNRVSIIEPFTIRRKPVSDAADLRDQKMAPQQWEIPNLVFYVLPQDSQAWVAWHDDFVVQGHNSDDQEKTFTLELLSSDLKDTLLRLEGSGVGIVSAKYEQSVTATSGSPASPATGFRVEVYVEQMRIATGGKPGLDVPTLKR
jgi:hypothetical protein